LGLLLLEVCEDSAAGCFDVGIQGSENGMGGCVVFGEVAGVNEIFVSARFFAGVSDYGSFDQQLGAAAFSAKFGHLIFLWEHCGVASGLILCDEDFLILSAGELYGAADEIVVCRLSLEDLGCLHDEVCDVGDVEGGF